MWFLGKGNASYSASQTTAKEHKKTPEFVAMPAKPKVLDVKPSIKNMPKEQHEFNEDIAKAASAVAQQYQQSLAFPPYSQPLTVYDEDRLKPNQFFPVTSPVGEKIQTVLHRQQCRQ